MAANSAVRPAFKQAPTRTPMDVLLGNTGKLLGRLVFVKDGQRQFSQFAYSEDWLADSQVFDVSPDLQRQSGHQLRKPLTKNDSCFFLALADTEPHAWGRRVIARAHAKDRAKDASLGPLTEADYLACVDDFSRVGALRLRDERGHDLRSVADGARSTPALLELEKILFACRAVDSAKKQPKTWPTFRAKRHRLAACVPNARSWIQRALCHWASFPA